MNLGYHKIIMDILGYPQIDFWISIIHFWISKSHAEFWISIIRFLDIQKSVYFRISKNHTECRISII